MFENKKFFLYAALLILALFLFNAWKKDYPDGQKPKSIQSSTINHVVSNDKGSAKDPFSYVPSAFDTHGGELQTAVKIQKETSTQPVSLDLVHVLTDVLDVSIDLKTGNVVSARLLKYPVTIKEKQTPIQILNNTSNKQYLAESGLTADLNNQSVQNMPFTTQYKKYHLLPKQNRLTVTLSKKTSSGLVVQKKYTFEKNRYAVHLAYYVENKSKQSWSGSLFVQLVQRRPDMKKHFFGINAYHGAAISTPHTPYEKVTYADLSKENIDRTIKGGWLAVQQHYFLSAWVPGDSNQTYHYYSHIIKNPDAQATNALNDTFVLGFVTPIMNVKVGESLETHAMLYVGPEIASRLKVLAPGLERTIDYGWLWPVSMLLFVILSTIHGVIGNWGWAIVITTILIKILFYWFSAKSFRSMAKMREMQPRMQELKEQHGNDRQTLSRATMEFYRKEKINPLGGCLPMVIQIPVFIAFYYVIMESVQLRQAPFVFWIHDLSVMDPYYILPILMGLSMLAQQVLSPTTVDPTQQKMMWILPVIFTFFFASFPAGLVLYWFINNVVQTLQQWYVNQTYEHHKAKLKSKQLRKKKK